MEVLFYRSLTRLMPLLITLFIITFIAGMFGLSLLPPRYQATARILVERKPQDIPMLDRYQSLSTVMVRNELERLKSVTLFKKAMERLGLDSDPFSKIFITYHKGLQVKQLPSSTVLQVQVGIDSPKRAAELTNTLIECLMEENQENRKTEIEQAVNFLTEKIEEVRLEKQELTRYQGSSSLKRSNIQPTLSDVRRKLSLYESEFKNERRKIPVQDWNRVSYLFSDNYIWIKNYQKSITLPLASLAVLMQNTRSNAGSIKQLQSQIWREKVNTVNLLKNSLNQFRIYNVDWEKLSFAYLRMLEMKLFLVKLNELPKTGTPVKVPEVKKLDSLSKMETELIEKLTDLQVSGGLADLEIQWLDKALPPIKPYFPTLTLNIMLSFIAGLAISMFALYAGFIIEAMRAEN